MAKKSQQSVQTFLGPRTTLEGTLTFKGTVRLDGHFSGTIISKNGTIVIGKTGVIHADISVQKATISGEVRGNINAVDRIELRPPARVYGDLNAPVVLIDEGVVFDGKCSATPRQTQS
ncbi:MAG: polymer-forming cytoskeletal protein [Deltaproteobacteria bacterium]|nr:polymer-forming cytoskeletal protein [Deltaproteobacteria bacterium]